MSGTLAWTQISHWICESVSSYLGPTSVTRLMLLCCAARVRVIITALNSHLSAAIGYRHATNCCRCCCWELAPGRLSAQWWRNWRSIEVLGVTGADDLFVPTIWLATALANMKVYGPKLRQEKSNRSLRIAGTGTVGIFTPKIRKRCAFCAL